MSRQANQGSERRAGARGFTLLELLVAVGIAALLAVAVAGVFDAVGKTVGSGRRLSELNVYAAMIEQTMRRDFEAMSPDGFLVIRNERTNDGQQEIAAQLAEGDSSPRVRRIDEIAFISRGRFATQREPLDPTRVAASDAARIYFGMGKRRVDLATTPPGPGDPISTTDKYRVPVLNDQNVDPMGNRPVSGLGEAPGPAANYINPNRYASEWNLLRHVTLLAPASTAPVTSTGEVFSIRPDDANRRLDDSDRQIALQPAASSLFGTLSKFEYAPPAANAVSAGYDQPLWLDGIPAGATSNPGPTAVFPSAASGVVDIATTDLGEVRTLISPHYWSTLGANGSSVVIYLPKYMTRARLDDFKANKPRFPFLRLPIPDSATYEDITRNFVRPLAIASQAWMLDAMPASSALYTLPAAVTISGSNNAIASPTTNQGRTRVRAESEPPALLSMLALPDSTPTQRLQKAMALTDQAMLTRFNFVPRCTEFIVEWSMGEVYGSSYAGKAGQTVWYGLARPNGITIGGQPDSATVEGAKSSIQGTNLSKLPEGAYPARIDQVTLPSSATAAQRQAEELRRVRLAEMIHGGIASSDDRPGRGFALESFFGQDLPVPDLDGNESQKWEWPKYIRVTMSFVSEREPTLEQTYQVVFPVPKR
jgi:prepilin-type N-terminal cleavage/methylation domain-containing protein